MLLSRRNHWQKALLVGFLIVAAVTLILITTLSVQGQGQANYCTAFNRSAVMRIDPGPLFTDLFCRAVLLKEVHPYAEQTGPFYWIPPNERLDPFFFAPNIEEYDLLAFIRGLDVQAVIDIYSKSGVREFEEGVPICLRASGSLLFVKTSKIPREIIESPMYRVPEQPGFICTTIWEPGLLLMTQDAVPTPLYSCQVLTRYTLRLRGDATDETNNTLTMVPVGTVLEASGYLPGWFHVNYEGTQGWITTDRQYVSFDGDCAEMLCAQEKRGFLIQCER
jgi:hypothetical protein